jgi:hypothetical protein
MLIDDSEYQVEARDVAEACALAVPVCAPGEAFSYSNAGYALIGIILEAALNTDWLNAVTRTVLYPLGMTSVRAVGSDQQGVLASGHYRSPASGRVQSTTTYCPQYMTSAGGALGTAYDLMRFGLMNSREASTLTGLPVTDLAALRRPLVHLAPVELADGWGLGVGEFRASTRAWYGHDGTIAGATAHLRFEPDTATVVACTTNAAWGIRLWDGLIDALADDGIEVGIYRHARSQQPGESLVGLRGSYRNGANFYEVAVDERQVTLQVDGGPAIPIDVDDGLGFEVPAGVNGGSGGFGRFCGASARASCLYVDGIRAPRENISARWDEDEGKGK